MSTLTVRHVTTYRYRNPVSFGEHRMMMRPREGHDQRVLASKLVMTPEPVSQRWMLDIFGNHVAYARFAGRADELRFDSTVTLAHTPSHMPDFPLEEYARSYPFTYGAEDMPDLLRLIERHSLDPQHEVDRWARQFLHAKSQTDTRALLTNMNQAIRHGFTYVAREEKGIQSPVKTLKLGSGSCRDFAVLMMEAVRALGFAARFVSGYLYVPSKEERPDEQIFGGGATHAWLQIFLPGAGWMEFDPTNGSIGNRDLIRVAVVRDPSQAVPLSGSWGGFPADNLGMSVEVTVTKNNAPLATELKPLEMNPMIKQS